jgi:hypothetical protein
MPSHATSVHFIGQQYYQYDGMQRDGVLGWLGDADEAPASMGEAIHVVSFRL